MKHEKATKLEVQTAINRLSDKKKREELFKQFFEDCVTTTCGKCLEAYGDEEGHNKALEFLSDLYMKDMISDKFFLQLSTALALSDLLTFITKEGDDHGKD